MDTFDKEDFNKIEGKLDKLDTRLDNIDITLAKQSIILEVHVKRSELLEDLVIKHEETNEKKFKYIYKFIDKFKFIGWFFGGILGIALALKELGFF